MILLDSNILIYSAKPEAIQVWEFLSDNDLSISAISLVEVLGYRNLNADDEAYLKEFIQSCQVLDIRRVEIDLAIDLRHQRKMSLGDSIIAATASSYTFPGKR
ncbi:MAG: type II toxin-antitoxin system VapC family toxin [Owenweeksia sp.]|nr:type II toxin-antitoxin system VapC family toxin [Owenweeksia sp.]